MEVEFMKKQFYKSKPLVLLLSVFLVMSSFLVYAVWLSSFSETSGLIIQSENDISFVETLNIDTINVSEQSFNKSEIVQVENNNGNQNYTFTAIENISDVVSDGCNPNGDVSYYFEWEGVEVISGENITASLGTNTLRINTTVLKQSCPQNTTLKVNLTAY